MRQAGLVLVTGGIAAAANVASRIAYSGFMPLAAAVVLAGLTGMIVAFLLVRRSVFEHAVDDTARRAGRFAVVNALAVPQTLAVTVVGARLLRDAGAGAASETIAHVAGVVLPVFSSYVMRRRWTFSARAGA